MKQYVITSPPWETTSGGVRVLFGLYGHLLARGQVAFMNQKLPNVKAVAIYPEIQQGNPVEAETVVRYILNTPGRVPALMSDGSLVPGPTEFPETDLLYYFSRLYAPEGTPDENILFLPILDLHLFKDQKKKRTKKAYMIGKGMNYPLKLSHPTDAIEIDRVFAQDQQALADFLNECEVFYCYDPNTAMTEIARLCGVRVVMFNPLYTKEEFSKYEPGMMGISWGQDEGVKLNTIDFRMHYADLKNEFDRQLDRFIQIV